MSKLASDYLGVHLPTYQRIAAGERDGWSSPADVAAAMASVRRALALPGAPDGGRLLELGCGDGCLTAALAGELPFAVSGIEIVPLALELGRRRLSAAGVLAELALGPATELPWPNGTFDAVVDGLCLHCIVPADRARAFSEVRRVLRHGGLFCVMTMIGDPPPDMARGFDPQTRCVVRDGVAGRYFGTEESVLAELRAAGFAIAEHWVEPPGSGEENPTLCAAAIKPRGITG